MRIKQRSDRSGTSGRLALAWLGVILVVAVLVPPGLTAARHYVYAQAVQFAVLAVVAPALLVLGAPWRVIASGLTDRVATARSHRRTTWPAWACLIAFLAAAVGWRLPVAVNALEQHPALLVAEAVTLLGFGCALWLELVESPPLLPTISRPLRAAFAVIPMWGIWTIAYIMGFSGTVWFGAFAHAGSQGLRTVVDQEIAVALLWAIPGLAFAPVVFVSLLTWMREGSDIDHELAGVGLARPGPPRPPRGWRR